MTPEQMAAMAERINNATPEQIIEAARRLREGASMPSEWIKTLDALMAENGLRFTFSINCHSGIASLLGPDHRCGCWRCRKERGEPSDEQTEEQAALDSKAAQAAMRATEQFKQNKEQTNE